LGVATEGLAGGVVRGGATSPPRPPVRGAVHASEIEYALGNLDVQPMYAWTAKDYEVSRVMHGYFMHFVQSGDPNAPGLPTWPVFSSGQRMTLDVVAHAEPDRASARAEVLDKLAEHGDKVR